MRKQFILSLSPAEARRLLGSLRDMLRRVSVVDEVGSNYVTVVVPKGRRGTEKVRLLMDIYETENSTAAILYSDTDMMFIDITAARQGVQTAITVTCQGVGRVERIIDTFGNELANLVRTRLESAYPSTDINEEDNKLAALEKSPPLLTTLVYYDSFIPVFNVVLESALSVLSALGPDHYLVEVESLDEREPFTLRLVVRENKVTGLYAELPGQRLRGDSVLYANFPLARRVNVKAWALYGGRETVVYAPLEIASSGDHRVYWVSVKGCAACGGLLSNSFMVVDRREAVLVNPAALEERHIVHIEELLEGLENLRHIVLTHVEADLIAGIETILSHNPRVYIHAPPYHASLLNSAVRQISANIKTLPLRESETNTGRTRLLVLEGAASSPHNIALYDPASKVLFAGVTLGSITPPGLWAPFVSDVEEYLKTVAPYVTHLVNIGKLRAWTEKVSKLDVEIIAPHYGPLVIGRDEVRSVIARLRELADLLSSA